MKYCQNEKLEASVTKCSSIAKNLFCVLTFIISAKANQQIRSKLYAALNTEQPTVICHMFVVLIRYVNSTLCIWMLSIFEVFGGIPWFLKILQSQQYIDVFGSNKYCSFINHSMTKTVVFQHYLRKRSGPLFSKTQKQEKLKYCIA